MMRSRELHLKSRPVGLPQEEDFELVEIALPEINDGEVLVKNTWMSVDPYMRRRMGEEENYTEAFQLGAVLDGSAMGQVVESRHKKFSPGDHVYSMSGWREYFVSQGDDIWKRDVKSISPQVYLSLLGLPGITAYVGLLSLGQPKAGDTVFVSAASGAVGMVVCQLAKLQGCRVVGSAGSDEKTGWLMDEIGIDAAINYKTTKCLEEGLGQACPDGIDVYFDNVGGEHLEAALSHMKKFGRVMVCGLISHYNSSDNTGPRNFDQILIKSLTFQGFIVLDHWDKYKQFTQDMTQWIKEGKIISRDTTYLGLDNAPEALLGLFSGKNIGKMLVKLAEPLSTNDCQVTT